MGPRATVRFEEKLIQAFSGSDQACPDIVVFNIGRIPDRTAFLQENGSDPVSLMSEITLRAQRAGATLLCIPCNTAHAERILSRVEPYLDVPLLNMPAMTLGLLKSKKFTRSLVLATDGSIEAGIFNSPTSIYPSATTQASVMNVIKSIKTSTSPSEKDIAMLLDNAYKSGADSIVLACTELSFLEDTLAKTGVTIIDTLDVLVDGCVQYIERSTVWPTTKRVLAPTNTQ